MKIIASELREQGVNFAIVLVKKHILDNPFERAEMIRSCQNLFPRVPVVLAAQNFRGDMSYYGRQDIAKFLSRVPFQAIPWSEYRVR